MNTATQTKEMVISNPEEVTLKATSQELVTASKNAVVMTFPDLSEATDLCKLIKTRINEAEEARKKITVPLNAALDEVNARFKTISEPLKEAEQLLKNKMVAFSEAEEKRAKEEAARKEKERQEQERKDREAAEARRKQEEEQAADPTLDRAAPSFPPSVEAVKQEVAPIKPEIRKTTYGQTGASFTAKKVWDYELTDLSLVPREFLILDTSKVGAVVKAGIREIAGIRIYQKSTASVR